MSNVHKERPFLETINVPTAQPGCHGTLELPDAFIQLMHASGLVLVPQEILHGAPHIFNWVQIWAFTTIQAARRDCGDVRFRAVFAVKNSATLAQHLTVSCASTLCVAFKMATSRRGSLLNQIWHSWEQWSWHRVWKQWQKICINYAVLCRLKPCHQR